jgi:hypothetical protein
MESLVTSLKFENILQYVHIPAYKLSTYPKGEDSSEVEVDGRTDFKLIFDLLQTKGVSKIIRVIVEDDNKTPHRDEIIVELCQDFGIEEWDWKKTDLCSEVIRKAAVNAEKVFLYSSGNNAVLRSWSGTDGLKQLPKVRLLVIRPALWISY